MQLEGIDTQQISRIEDPFNPSDLKKKKKVCNNVHLLRMGTESKSDLTHVRHFVLIVMCLPPSKAGRLCGSTSPSFITEGLLCNGVIIFLRTK